MRVDVIDVLWLLPALRNALPHRPLGALTILGRGRDVIRIPGQP